MSETEKAQMTGIRAARGRVKTSLTRLENTFNEINTRNEISIQLSRLDDLFQKFERLDSILSLEESELQEFEERKGDRVSTKLRVVFDDICKPSNGNSHNSILGIGKMLQLDPFTILVKFRLNEIAFSANIQQMYRQILIDQEDQNFQRIVWRESKDSPIRKYKLCTVTYGTASAPYLATRCLFQTGLDLERDDLAVSSLIKESFYYDDLMVGTPFGWIHTACQQITLHGFCDASEVAYASVIYTVQPQTDDNTKVTLLVAKSRVAPLKSVSIPRSELNGALLLAHLYATCKNILKVTEVHFYACTDSQVVLSWRSSHPRNWKPYISNKTSEILGLGSSRQLELSAHQDEAS
ncbi:uncharacterized protein TNCV_1965951 [Trichonephila clavipes]|nr:uncharacterized protein TNCV_1965951 [Trichonephila clavipes]